MAPRKPARPSFRGLNWQTITLPFGGSLETKQDPRIKAAPDLSLLRDGEFEEVGGIQTRHPFGSVMGSGAIVGGGTISDVRKLVANGDELVLFTKDTVYSWNAGQSKWVSCGTHLAVSVDEVPRFVTTGDQIEGDRAELSGTVVYAWVEGSQVYAAALDKTTGSVMVAPSAVSTAIGRPRLVALSTKIMLFVEASTTLLTVRAIDPASPATAIQGAGTTVLATDFNLYYDVVKAGTQDLVVGACRRQTTTSYTVFKVTPALSVTTSTKARTCDGPIAVATIADGTQTQIVRGNSTNIQGDLVTTSTLADVNTGQAIGTVVGTPVNQITAAFNGTTCTAFWDSLESTDATNASFAVKMNTVTTANSVGTQSTLVKRLGIASRAFLWGSNVFVWLVFGEEDLSVLTGTPLGIRAALQNSYFLYRDDGLIVSKAAWQTAGSYSAATGHLPGVAATSTTGNDFAWAGLGRRTIVLDGDRSAYAARSPHDVSFSFDDDAARRCVSLGKTIYVAGSFLQGFDGVRLAEIGFFVTPWSIDVQDSGVAGNITAGTYSWKGTYRFTNAQGETERSTTATGDQITFSASHFAIISFPYLYVTNKTTVLPALEFWRTLAGPGAESDFLLVTGQDPNTTTGDNPYIPNNTGSTGSTCSDNFSDTTLAKKEANPENGAVLESLAPPGATILVPTETRLLITGITGDPDAWWYSRERGDGEIASFHDSLRVDVPPTGGDITAMWTDDQFVYVARETAIYAFAGTGFDNAGGGQNFVLSRTVSRDVGAVSQEAHAATPMGRVFKSSKGWYLLDQGGGLRYIGAAVADFDSDTVKAVHTITSQHQVRILTGSRLLVWDYRGLVDAVEQGAGRWAEWTISDGLDAVVYNGTYTYLTSTGPKQEETSFVNADATFGLDVETAWIKPADLMGAVALRMVQALGEIESSCLVRMRIAYNYDEAFVDDVVLDAGAILGPLPANSTPPLQFSHGPKRRQCNAFKIRLTAVVAGTQASLATATGLVDTATTSVTTSGTAWAATFAAKTGNNDVIGELANNPSNTLAMTIAFESGAANSIDVRDHYTYDIATATWSPLLYNVGVRVVFASLTVAALETAILAGTDLLELSAADGTPTKTIAAGMDGLSVGGVFAGGTFGAPTGEAIKLSGLGLEVGIEPGLYRRLPGSQKV